MELIDQFIEGFVPVPIFRTTTISLIRRSRALIGRNGEAAFRLGDRLTVQVARVDKLLRRAYFLPGDLAAQADRTFALESVRLNLAVRGRRSSGG